MKIFYIIEIVSIKKSLINVKEDFFLREGGEKKSFIHSFQ